MSFAEGPTGGCMAQVAPLKFGEIKNIFILMRKLIK